MCGCQYVWLSLCVGVSMYGCHYVWVSVCMGVTMQALKYKITNVTHSPSVQHFVCSEDKNAVLSSVLASYSSLLRDKGNSACKSAWVEMTTISLLDGMLLSDVSSCADGWSGTGQSEMLSYDLQASHISCKQPLSRSDETTFHTEQYIQ